MLTKKEAKRLEALEKLALDNFIANSNYYAEEWLEDDEAEEFCNLKTKNF